MAFALSASCPKSSSFQAVQSPSLLPRQTVAMVMGPRQRKVVDVIKAVAMAPPPVVDAIKAATMVPPPAKPTEMRCRPVSETMATIKAKGKTAFIPYITAGDPDLATTAQALSILDACGADVIELGMPYSEPYVDGPILQASMARALAAGTTMEGVLGMLKEVTPELSCPVVLFSYYQPIFAHGLAGLKEAGVTVIYLARSSDESIRDLTSTQVLLSISVPGLLVHDLPYVAADAMWSDAKNNNLEMVLATTPTTPAERMKEITKASEGLIYLVSASGATGPRENVNSNVQSLIQEVKKINGISKPEHVKQITQWGADGVIIGSAMVQQLGESASPKEGLKRLEKYARSMKNALP